MCCVSQQPTSAGHSFNVDRFGSADVPTHVRLDRQAEFAKRGYIGTWKILRGLIENRDLQLVVLFCLLGLVGFFTVRIYFPNVGALITEYNQF
jgi:hypothetical protein